MSARGNILGKVRAALGRDHPMTDGEAASMRAKLSDHPRGPRPSMDWEPVSRFRERCISLSSTVHEVASLDQVPGAVAHYVSGNDLPRTGVCWPEFVGLDWAGAGLSVEGRPATGEDKIGITGTYCAIAETGTLMLLSGPDTPHKTSLLPETHIAIVAVSRILRSMEDAWDRLRAERGELPRQVGFISGPSRTADIEMTLVLGIHGPCRVHIILVPG